MAAFPNLHVKLSGLGMFSGGVTLPQARQVIRDTIQIFGIERTIYGSNFPLEKLHASYADFFGVYRTVLAEYPEAEQRKVLHDNAVNKLFYKAKLKPTAVPCKSYSSARSILTVAISPTRSGRRLAT